MRLSKSYIFIGFLFIIFACNRNDEITKDQISIDNGDIEVLLRSSVSGSVFDENGLPVESAIIEVNGEVYYTDINGVFNMQNTLLPDTGAVIKFSKSGYFTQYEKVKPKLNGFQNLIISLYEKNGAQVIQSNTNSELFFSDNTIKLSITKNNLQKSNNETYNGSAKIIIKSPDNQQFFIQPIPNSGGYANLNGITKNGTIKNISPLFSFFVNCESDKGELLKFKDSITFSIANNLFLLTGQKISVWNYDEKSGNWLEKSSKFTEQSSQSVQIKIKDQGYFIISPDYSGLADISGKVTYNDGNPASYIFLLFQDNNASFSTIVITDQNGQYSVQVPKNLEIKCFGSNCGITESEHNLGLINNDKVFDFIINSSSETININNIYEQNGNIVNNGFAGIISDFGITEYYRIKNDSMGQVISTNSCNPHMILYDLDNLPIVKQSNIIDISNPIFNSQDHPAKYETQSYYYIIDDNNNLDIFDAQPTFFEEAGIYYLSNNSNSINVFMKFAKTGQNKYEGALAYVKFNNSVVQYFESDPSDTLELEIISDNSSELSGSFTGTLTIESNKTNISGYFKIQR